MLVSPPPLPGSPPDPLGPRILYKEPSGFQKLGLEAWALKPLKAALRSPLAAEEERQSQVKPQYFCLQIHALNPLPRTGKKGGKQGGEGAGDPCMQVHLSSQPQKGAD